MDRLDKYDYCFKLWDKIYKYMFLFWQKEIDLSTNLVFSTFFGMLVLNSNLLFFK